MVDASFFDIFGFIGFLYIFVISLFLFIEKKLPKWTILLLLIISILGIIVDGLIIFYTYVI